MNSYPIDNLNNQVISNNQAGIINYELEKYCSMIPLNELQNDLNIKYEIRYNEDVDVGCDSCCMMWQIVSQDFPTAV